MVIELTREELELLRELLKRAYGDLREEIYKTETFEYKMELKRQEVVLEGIMNKVAQALVPAGG